MSSDGHVARTATEGLGCCTGVNVCGVMSVVIQASFARQRDSGLSIDIIFNLI